MPTIDISRRLEIFSNQLVAIAKPKRNIRFEDVEKTFKTFSRNKGTNINSWINHFSDQCIVFELNEFEKFIFAKRLTKGNAKQFIEHESEATIWNELEDELTKEYGKNINSAIPGKTKEKRGIINSIYVQMLSIATQTNIDIEVVITYIVDGPPGSAQSKSFMYGAETLKDYTRR